MIEGLGEHADLVWRSLGVNARGEVAGVHPRRGAGHAPQGLHDACGQRGAEQDRGQPA